MAASARVAEQYSTTWRIALAGDVMLGRGIDQILGCPSAPELREAVCRSAVDYVSLAEMRRGKPLPRAAAPAYPWGDALKVRESEQVDALIVNLETSVTTSGDFAPKGINYRMHPRHVASLQAARVDCCALANNHVMDFGVSGLLETLDVLDAAHIGRAGAGRSLDEAAAPAVLKRPGGDRVLVWSCCLESSGVPQDWGARPSRPGVWLLRDLSEATLGDIEARISAVRRPRDLAVVSIHWGPNWGYRIPAAHRRFAYALVEEAGTEIVHGHSSHHPKSIEVHGGRLILYGCGDFINDYEGIGGYEEFAPDLSLLYLADVDSATGNLQRLRTAPFQIGGMRLNEADSQMRAWLVAMIEDPARGGGLRVRQDGLLALHWQDESGPNVEATRGRTAGAA